MTAAKPETIQGSIAAIVAALPTIAKDSRNTQQNFNYRSHDDVMNALKPLLAEHGVIVIPEVLERVESHRTTGSGSTMYEVNLHIRFTFYGPAGDFLAATAWGEGTDMGDKSTNKATTMAFKNALAIVFAISTGEYDTDQGSPQETRRGSDAPPATRGRQQREKSRTFDRSKDLLEGAIKPDAHVWKNLGESLTEIGPTLDWKETLSPLIHERFGVDDRHDIEKAAELYELAVRLANAIAKLSQTEDITAFPPVEERAPEALVAAFHWAFETEVDMPLVVDRTIEEAEAALAAEALAAAVDDIPFGEDAPEAEREHKDPTS